MFSTVAVAWSKGDENCQGTHFAKSAQCAESQRVLTGANIPAQVCLCVIRCRTPHSRTRLLTSTGFYSLLSCMPGIVPRLTLDSLLSFIVIVGGAPTPRRGEGGAQVLFTGSEAPCPPPPPRARVGKLALRCCSLGLNHPGPKAVMEDNLGYGE